MKNILVFNHSFFVISETFIHKQVEGLTEKNNVSLLGYSFLNQELFPVRAKSIQLNRLVNLFDKIVSIGKKDTIGNNVELSFVNKLIVKQIPKKQNIELIHAHFGPSGISILPVAKALNIPLVVSFHGYDAAPILLKHYWYSQFLEDLFNYSKALIIVSPHMVDTLKLMPWKNKVHLVNYGIDFNKFSPTGEKPSSKDGKIRILHSGRLVGKKGVPDLIKVFINLCNVHKNILLEIIGDGPEAIACQELLSNLNCGKFVQFHGAQSQTFVKQAMNDADIFVLNCRIDETGDMEGSPVSILEAMSMKLPVISTFHAGVPSLLTNNVNGLLVHERNNCELSDALAKLIVDSELRIQLGEKARETVIQKFSLEVMQEGISKILA